MNRILFFALCIYSQVINGQEIVLSGTVQSDGEPLPFATLGILNKNIGTIANDQGVFVLTIPESSVKDTLIVSYLGYKSRSFIPSTIASKENWQVHLEKDTLLLRPVVVVDQRAKKSRLGGKKEKNTYVWVSAKGKGAEVATLMQPKFPVFLNKVGVQILNKERFTFKLLLNVYEQDAKTLQPGKSLLLREILIESDQESGWLEVLIDSENIIVDEPFYVSFKWVDVEKRRPQIAINDKLASRTRYVALGKWMELFNWNIRAEGVRIGTKRATK